MLSIRAVYRTTGPWCRPLVFAHAAVLGGLALTGLVAAWGLVRGLLAGPPLVPQTLDWLALIATGAALVICLWDRAARFPLAGLYVGGLTAVGMGQIQRGLAPAQFFLWGGVCDLAGFVLVAALLGWVLAKLGPVASRLRIPADARRWSGQWFRVLQAVLALASASLVVWIATEVSFDELGQDRALLNLSGRLAACPAALMLLGTAILMAWQNRGPWRAGWQYAAMFAGMLFTSSIGWATMDAAAASPWLHRGVKLLISASMMTLLTGFGLGRILPRHSDWIQRGRRAMPAFGMLALVLLAMIVARRLW